MWEYLAVKLSSLLIVYGDEDKEDIGDYTYYSLRLSHQLTRKFGKKGWELVSVDNGVAYFKRPIEHKPSIEEMRHKDEMGV